MTRLSPQTSLLSPSSYTAATSDPTETWQIQEENVTKFIFTHLDPTVRELLIRVQEYRTTWQPLLSQTNSLHQPQKQRDDQHDMTRDFEKILTILKQKTILLRQLETKLQEAANDIVVATTMDQNNNPSTSKPLQESTIQSSTSTAQRRQQQQQQQQQLLLSKSLVTLSDFILLPVVTIVKFVRAFEDAVDATTCTSTSSSQRLAVIRQAAQRECVQAAAKTWMTLLMMIQSGGTICSVDEYYHRGRSRYRRRCNGVDHRQNQQCEGTGVSPRHDRLRHGLTISAAALPAAKAIVQELQKLDHHRGDDCCDSLLQTLQSLVILYVTSAAKEEQRAHLHSTNQDTRNENGIGSASTDNSTFLAIIVHIVDICAELMGTTTTHDGASGRVSKISLPTSSSLRLRAIRTLDCLVEHVPDVNMWRAFFPGCFKSLAQVLFAELRWSGATSSSQEVGAEALETLARFLCLTLTDLDVIADRLSHEQSAVKQSLERLKGLAVKEQVPNADDEMDNTVTYRTSKLDEGGDNISERLLREVNRLLPKHIVAILNLVTESRLDLVRQAAPYFCRVILLDTANCWDTTAAASVLVAAMECCLILQNDSNELVASHASSILSEVQREHVGCNAASDVVARIQELVEELPTLARGTKETSLCNRLNLVNGYLDLFGSMTTSLSKMETKRVVSQLMATVNACRPALSELFDLDFRSSMPFSPHSVVLSIVDEADCGSPLFHFRYMSGESSSSAEAMVQRLGRLMGSSNAAVFIDGCIADTFETISSCVDSGSTVSLNELVGQLFLARHVLMGAFSHDARTMSNPSTMESSSPSRSLRKRSKHFVALASSILPLLCNPLFVRLPSNFREPLDHYPSRHDQERPIGSTNTVQVYISGESRVLKPARFPEESSASRECFSVCVLELIVVVFITLKEKAETFIPIVITTIIEIADSHNHMYLRRQAVSVLRRLADICGLKDVAELVNCHLDHLIGSLLGRLRVRGGHLPKDTNDFDDLFPLSQVACFILRNASEAEKCITRESTGNGPILLRETRVSMLVQFVSTLIRRFDIIIGQSATAEHMSAMIQICGAAMCYLGSTYHVEQNRELIHEVLGAVGQKKESWRKVLLSFRKGRGLRGISEIASESSVDTPNMTLSVGRSDSLLAPGRTEIDFVSLVLARCCYALSFPELKIQVASCDCIEEGFKLLSIAACIPMLKSESETRNVVLEQVSETWPAFFARFRTLSSSLSVGSSDIVVRGSVGGVFHRSESDSAVNTVLLARMFDVLASMSEACGEFISSRFQSDIWPAAARLLGTIIANHEHLASQDSVGASKERFLNKSVISSHHVYTNSGERLLLAILSCFARLFEHRECGESLSNLILPIGSTILPFLQDDSNVGEMTVTVLKAMIRVDCDALWRPLWKLSGRQLPKRPSRRKNSNAILTFEEPQSLFAKRASQLLDYLESVPEQDL